MFINRTVAVALALAGVGVLVLAVAAALCLAWVLDVLTSRHRVREVLHLRRARRFADLVAGGRLAAAEDELLRVFGPPADPSRVGRARGRERS